MVNDIFPPKEREDMSDRDWETYCCQVWCCNSLNACEGTYRHKDGPNSYAAQMLERAQKVIWFLLEDSGRLEKKKEEENVIARDADVDALYEAALDAMKNCQVTRSEKRRIFDVFISKSDNS